MKIQDYHIINSESVKKLCQIIPTSEKNHMWLTNSNSGEIHAENTIQKKSNIYIIKMMT